MSLQEWIDENIADIAKKLPTLVYTEPASFSCGFNTGYKQAMLDLDRFLEDEDKHISFYHCGHCTEEICFTIECPVCGKEDEPE